LGAVKARDERDASDAIAWAQRVNSRWIAHGGLSDNATRYLEHLGQVDPDRLGRSCQRAHRLVRACVPGEDPKPWFYAALFSLATDAEIRRFLVDHWFTRAAHPSSTAAVEAESDPGLVGDETQEKLDRIRQALRSLPGEGGSK
jgi:hypothetical protein